MKRLRFQERLIDPRSPDRRPRRAAYALPTLFTAGNVFLGFYAHHGSFRGAILNAPATAQASAAASGHFRAAAIAIGVAVFLDGLDGRIARLTKTVSDFGREMDSLADVISFGIAPAVLAYAWGVEFASSPPAPITVEHLHRAGYFCAFLFLLCGAMRLARFNVQNNPVPKNPGRAGSQIFRRHADSRRGRHGGQRGLRLCRRRPLGLVGIFHGVAGAARAAFVSDGQHLALSQLQGPEPGASAIAADLRGAEHPDLPDLEFFPTRAAGNVGLLRSAAGS